MSYAEQEKKVRDLEDAFAVLSNAGGYLTGNTQASDLEWFAGCLFEASRLGAAAVETVPWLIGREQWEALGLTPMALMGDGPRRWDMLTEEQKEAWRKLARICWYVLPTFAERVGNRFLEQAAALRALWKKENR